MHWYAQMNKGLFLDRDGVINVDKGYVHRIEDFDFLPGIFAFCRQARALGYKIFVFIIKKIGVKSSYLLLRFVACYYLYFCMNDDIFS